MSELLKVEGLTKRFGGVTANDGISFDVRAGEILGVIGPNGAGKSTLFDLLTGFQKPDAGTVILEDLDVTGMRPDRIARMGVGRTFQKLKPFPDLTLLENVMVGALAQTSSVHEARDKALEAISFVELLEKRYSFARELSTGQRKRLEMARALATGPRLLLMDEVTGGVDQKTIPGLINLLLALRDKGITILTIEHNMSVIMEVSDRILALQFGKRIAFGLPEKVQNDSRVVDAYLGTVDAA